MSSSRSALTFSLLLAGACGAREDARLSALLLTLDTTNPEALSCYAATPHLDRLAAEGILFENARTVAPLTLPAHASMLTGLVPLRHSVRRNGAMVLPESAATLAERARHAGYDTAAIVAAVVLDPEFGLDQGFALYDAPATPDAVEEHLEASRRADEIAERALRWLDGREATRPFFLWLHFYDPHFPYDPPAEAVARAGGDPYLGEVAAMDAAIGRVLARLDRDGLIERTVVVAVGDHGESRGRHGEDTHGAFVFDSTLRVPLLVRMPRASGARSALRVDHPVSVADVHPTLVRALDLGAPGDVDGVDLLAPEVERRVYFESYFGVVSFGWSQIAGLAGARGKYVHSSAPEYYDLERDPHETTNALSARAAEAEAHRRVLLELQARPRLALAPLDGEHRGLLGEIERLGYAGADADESGLPDPLAPSERPSPHAMVQAYADFMQARKLMEEGGSKADAAALLERALAANPGTHKARFFLGLCLKDLGRFEPAIAAFRRALADPGGERIPAELNLAVCLNNVGERERAIEHLEHALADTIGPPGALALLVQMLEEAGRAEEAAGQRARLPAPARR